MRSGCCLLVLPLLSLTGCADSKPQTVAATVRDSSGITIVENGPFALADSTVWYADTSNVVRFGEMDGDGPYVFGRIVGLTRLANGNIAVGDAPANQVRFFDPAGRFLRRRCPGKDYQGRSPKAGGDQGELRHHLEAA